MGAGEQGGPGATRRLAAIGFGQGQAVPGVLGEGWCGAEPDATWTGAAQCTLRLALPADAGACVLRLRAAPFLAEGVAVQRLGVLGQGMLLGRFAFAGGLQLVEVPVPAALTEGAAALELVLLLPDAARPSEHSASGDDRLLALHVHDLELLGVEVAEGASAAWVAPAPAPGAALLLGFDALGSDAEFGLVQRRFGAEPYGLFRWAETDARGLAAALESGLDGVGDAQALTLVPEGAAEGGSWVAVHRRWGFRRHAGPALAGTDPEALREVEARRQAVGRERLLTALRLGGRVLVYKERNPAEAALLPALGAALQQLGANWLLWVGLGEPGRVERRGERLLHGTLDRFAPPGNLAACSAEAWLGLVEAAREAVGG